MIHAHLGKNMCKKYMYIRISCWFDKMKQNYWKPNRNLLRCLLTYDVFLSHDWGTNKENHLKVKDVNERLKEMGYVTWFDEDVHRMKGDMDSAMSQGIEESKVMLVFVTDAYRQKVWYDFLSLRRQRVHEGPISKLWKGCWLQTYVCHNDPCM